MNGVAPGADSSTAGWQIACDCGRARHQAIEARPRGDGEDAGRDHSHRDDARPPAGLPPDNEPAEEGGFRREGQHSRSRLGQQHRESHDRCGERHQLHARRDRAAREPQHDLVQSVVLFADRRAVRRRCRERQNHQHPPGKMVPVDKGAERRASILRLPEPIDLEEVGLAAGQHVLADGKDREHHPEDHQRARRRQRARAGHDSHCAEHEDREGQKQ